MPKRCAVYGCSATSASERSRTFHQFPKDPKSKQWSLKIRRENYLPNASSYVCLYHFAEDDFSNRNSKSSDTPAEFKKKTLKKGSIAHYNLRGEAEDQRIPLRSSLTSQRALQSTKSTPLCEKSQSLLNCLVTENVECSESNLMHLDYLEPNWERENFAALSKEEGIAIPVLKNNI